MTQPAWLDFPAISALNAGKDTRNAHDRLISNLTAMFGTTPNEFLTTSNVTFASVTATGTITANLFSGSGAALTFGSGFNPTFGNVTATTFTGDGTDITGITGISGGPEQPGNVTIKADSNNDNNGVITLQIFNTPAITINNNRTMIWDSSAITLSQDTNFVTAGGVNGFSIDGSTFSVDGLNHRVGILNPVPTTTLDVGGTIAGTSLIIDGPNPAIFQLGGVGDSVINAPFSLYINIDSDANSTIQHFTIGKDGAGRVPTDGGTKLFEVFEDGGVFCHLLLAAAASTDVNINGSNELHSVTSSRRYKENENDPTLDLSKYKDIRICQYDFKEEFGGGHEHGAIAEDMELIFPQFVYKKEIDGGLKPDSIQYSRVGGVLNVLKIQELEKRIEQLEP